MNATPDLQKLYVEVCKDREILAKWVMGILEGCEGCIKEAKTWVASMKGENGGHH